MDFQALVRSRRSARGFRNEAVQKTVIREIIEDAKRAPSSMNSQPYDEAIMTGIAMGYPNEALPGMPCAPSGRRPMRSCATSASRRADPLSRRLKRRWLKQRRLKR